MQHQRVEAAILRRRDRIAGLVTQLEHLQLWHFLFAGFHLCAEVSASLSGITKEKEEEERKKKKKQAFKFPVLKSVQKANMLIQQLPN